MKTIIARTFSCLLAIVSVGTAPAALIYDYDGPSIAVPDGNASGVSFHFSISDPAFEITDVSVTLNIAGGFNGDLYAYLAHGSGFAVLLNRVGVGETTPGSSALGYSDAGFSITLSSAASDNLHFYQNHNPVFSGGKLTGIWQTDSRFLDPGSTPSAFDAIGTAGLTSFEGLNPNGDWTLFLADLSPGGISSLEDFSVSISAVPEPVNAALLVFGGLAGICALFRRRGSRQAR